MFVLVMAPLTKAIHIKAYGNKCMTFEKSEPGSPLLFETCNLSDSNQKSWTYVSRVMHGPSAVCNEDLLCFGVGDDGKIYLNHLNLKDPAQIWQHEGNDHYTNIKIGSSKCAQIVPINGKSTKEYEMVLKKCNDDEPLQKFNVIA